MNHASSKVNIDWLSITTEPISITLTYAMLSGQAKLKVQMCGRRKLDKLLDTFQSFNLNIGVAQSKRYVTFYCILFFKNHLSF